MTSLGLVQGDRLDILADYESNAPTGISIQQIGKLEEQLVGIKTQSGTIVTPERAKRCTVVLACMRGISEDVASLPCNLLKGTADGEGGEIARDHTVHQILNVAPNEVMTPIDARELQIIDMMLHGQFFSLKNEDPDEPGVVTSVWRLDPSYVSRQYRQLVWTFTDPLTGQSGDFTPDLVWRGSMMGNGIDGMALTLLAREAIGIMLAAEEQGARLFSQGVQADFTISTDNEMDEPTQQQLREALHRRHAGSRNAWMPLILQGGLKASRLGLTAVESQYLESREFQTSDIARIFRYPEVLLGGGAKGKTSTFASAEQFFQSYTKHTLRPWTARIEQTISRDLLTKKERGKFFPRHDFTELLRGDTAARYASYATGIASGFLSPADVRRFEKLPFVPNLDYYTQPLNSAAVAGGDAAATKPTDVSGSTAPVDIWGTKEGE